MFLFSFLFIAINIMNNIIFIVVRIIIFMNINIIFIINSIIIIIMQINNL